MSPVRRAFVIMPFGRKTLPDGTEVDCDDIYTRLIEPAIAATGMSAHRADADRRGGSIHLDMFQDLLSAEFVVADLTMDNPNVWYGIGVRHALRAGGWVMTHAARDRMPFDIAGQRVQRYTLKEGQLDPDRLEDEREALTQAIEATLGAWRGRHASPVYQHIPSLREPDWKTMKVGDVTEHSEAWDAWQRRIEVARAKQRPGDILVLAEETPSLLEFEALRTAANALLGVRPDIVGEDATIVDRAERQLDTEVGRKAAEAEPKRVVVFSGHMIDDPAKRGPGKAKPARFPPEKIDAVAKAIRERLDKLGAGAGDLGLCGGASGGDLLFAEACLERGMRMEVRLARSEPEFLAESVTFADPDRRWGRSFEQVKDNKATTLFVMANALGPAPEGVSVHDRCNRWILYSALSLGLTRVSFVAVWNGEPGDGPGGTQHMVELVSKLTGRKPEIIDPLKAA